MIKNILKTIALILITVLLSGCNDFLEESSQDEVRPTTIDDLEQLANGEMYILNKIIDPYLDYLTDEIKCNGNQGKDLLQAELNSLLMFYTWDREMFEKVAEFPQLQNWNSWEIYYKLIMGCNVIMEYADIVEGNDTRKNHLKGQALVLRGYYYFQLVNLFGWPYNHGNPQENLGVPLKLTMKIDDKFLERNSVAEVYTQVVKDMEEGVKLLEDNKLENISKFKIDHIAANAMLSRVYLYMENWDKVITYADKVLAEKPELKYFHTEEDALASSFQSTFSIYNPEISHEIIWMYGQKERGAYFSSAYNSFLGEIPVYQVSDTLKSLYEVTWSIMVSQNLGDLRARTYFRAYHAFGGGFFPTPSPQYSYKGGEDQLYRYQGIRNAEIVLNRAEAYIQKYIQTSDENDRIKALKDLNWLRETRWDTRDTPYVPEDITDKEKLLIFYKNERQRELCGEGHRWFDLRRYGMPEIIHEVLLESGSINEYVLREKDSRYVLPIPRVTLELNPRLIQNP